jgi:PhoH-like ATPase
MHTTTHTEEKSIVTGELSSRDHHARSLRAEGADMYTPRLLIQELPAKELKLITPTKIMESLTEKPGYCNQFIKLVSQNNHENYRLFRYLGGTNFHEVAIAPLFNCFSPHNLEQEMALDLLLDDSVELVSLIGKAGTGKTFLVMLAGLIKVLHEKSHRAIMVTRPTVSLGPDIGFLPGDVLEKIESWMYPIFDNIGMIGSQLKKNKAAITVSAEALRKANQLSLQAMTCMRGRSLPHQFFFIDEAQNLTPLELKTLITRAGKGTKVIIAGDPEQIDSHRLNYYSNGLMVTTNKFMNERIFGVVHLHKSERSGLAQKAAELL